MTENELILYLLYVIFICVFVGQFLILIICFCENNLYMFKIKSKKDALLFLIPFYPMIRSFVNWIKTTDFKSWWRTRIKQFED